jgi:putative ABC transport system permease protein
MFSFITLIAKNLGRNKVRTALTAMAVTVLVVICAIVWNITESVRQRVEAGASQSKLIISERWAIPSRVPVRYIPEISKIRGVDYWASWNLYLGFFDESRQADKMGMGIATQPEALRDMFLASLPDSTVQSLRDERTGCIVGAAIMQSMGWSIGQEFTLLSSSHLGKNLRFKVVGALPAGEYSVNFFFRQDYFEEGTSNKDTVDLLWVRCRDAETSRIVASKIQQDYENRQPSLKAETESASVARFAEQGKTYLNLIRMVVAILLIDMVVILSNSISIATRERRTEMAILKVLGFKPVYIMALVIGEAMLIGGLSGLFGSTLAWGTSTLAIQSNTPLATFFHLFPIGSWTILLGLALGTSVGFLGSFFPAWSARNVKVSDVFSKIA